MPKRGDSISETRLAYSTQQVLSPVPVPRAREGTRPRQDGIRIRLDRRASDRVVTVVTGLPGSAAEVAALSRELKTACGAGGTVKDGVLALQGDHRDRVEALLDARGLRWKRSGG
jgi:translation initiation factor 1